MTSLRLPRLLPLCAALLAVMTLLALPNTGAAKPSLRLLSSTSQATLPKARANFPHPNDTHQVFFVQRSANANTVVYAAQFDEDGTLNQRRPVIAYWRRYGEQGQVMPLRWYEQIFAFGVKSRRHPDGDGYLVSVNAMRDYTVELRQTGPFQASLWTRHNNRDFELIYAYLDLDQTGVLPRVDQVRLYSSDPDTGRYMTHLIAVSGGEYTNDF